MRLEHRERLLADMIHSLLWTNRLNPGRVYFEADRMSIGFTCEDHAMKARFILAAFLTDMTCKRVRFVTDAGLTNRPAPNVKTAHKVDPDFDWLLTGTVNRTAPSPSPSPPSDTAPIPFGNRR